MKKILFAIALVFCFTQAYAGLSDDLFAGYPYASATWKSKTTVEAPDGNFSFEQTVYLKNKKMRTEGIFLNRATKEKENQITIIDGKMMYSINPDKKQGMKYSLSSPNNPAKADAAMVKCREKAKKTGSEKVNGVKCDKYEYACKMGNADIKITEYRNGKGFSIRTVSKMSGTTTTVDVTDLKVNASIPDSKFVPDKSIKFMDMQKIMSGDPIMKKGAKARIADEDSGDGDEDEDAGGGDEGKGNDDDGNAAAQKMMKDMMKGMMGE